MLQHIVLFCIDRFRGERSLAAIDHLLNGKKRRKRCKIVNGITLVGYLEQCRLIVLVCFIWRAN